MTVIGSQKQTALICEYFFKVCFGAKKNPIIEAGFLVPTTLDLVQI